MKKIIPFLLLGYLISTEVSGQSQLILNPDSSYSDQSTFKPIRGSREYYLEQSRTLNSLGTASLVLGGILIAAGFILHENGSDDVSGSWEVESEAAKAGAANFCKGAGVVLAAVSIPLFIAGGDAKQKAMSMTPVMSFQQADLPIGKTSSPNRFPSVGIRINL